VLDFLGGAEGCEGEGGDRLATLLLVVLLVVVVFDGRDLRRLRVDVAPQPYQHGSRGGVLLLARVVEGGAPADPLLSAGHTTQQPLICVF
jgi:hypothetical protein